MRLVDGIRAARTLQKTKKPLPLTAWAVVAAVVKEYGLVQVPPEESLRAEPRRRLEHLTLFPLLTAAQMQLCRELMEEFANPYLVYARSPEDFRASQLLFARQPDLPTEVFRHSSPHEILLQQGCLEGENTPQEGREPE